MIHQSHAPDGEFKNLELAGIETLAKAPGHVKAYAVVAQQVIAQAHDYSLARTILKKAAMHRASEL
jgi:hypothetical protein